MSDFALLKGLNDGAKGLVLSFSPEQRREFCNQIHQGANHDSPPNDDTDEQITRRLTFYIAACMLFGDISGLPEPIKAAMTP